MEEPAKFSEFSGLTAGPPLEQDISDNTCYPQPSITTVHNQQLTAVAPTASATAAYVQIATGTVTITGQLELTFNIMLMEEPTKFGNFFIINCGTTCL
jgi:hypothetical protein